LTDKERTRHAVNRAALPHRFPTHRHAPEFWEELGRTVACFGFLEETLLKAIFAITGTTECRAEARVATYRTWVQKLERSLSDPLGGLIDTYIAAIRSNSSCEVQDRESLAEEMKRAAAIRNALCHGSWRPPNAAGASVPFYINRKNDVFATSIDAAYLQQLQAAVVALACEVVDSITRMGWQFPGSDGPGAVIWESCDDCSE
jgi:hypothetical protein